MYGCSGGGPGLGVGGGGVGMMVVVAVGRLIIGDRRHLSGSGCNWLHRGETSLIWGPGERDGQLPPLVFDCLTASPLMLNAEHPQRAGPVACFVKIKRMNINDIWTRARREGGGIGWVGDGSPLKGSPSCTRIPCCLSHHISRRGRLTQIPTPPLTISLAS